MSAAYRVRALVLDFDGLVLDTESCVYEAWRAVYADHGVDLPLDRWFDAIGTDSRGFDPLATLRERVGSAFDEESVQLRRRAHRDALLHALDPMPGVEALLREARERRMRLAIASSSPFAWVHEHLTRLGMLGCFDSLSTEDDVAFVKPAPDLYLHAAASLGVAPAEAVALEDSPHGVAAAKAAGLRCVAVPGPMTRTLCFDGADVVIDSLAARDLRGILASLARREPGGAESP